MDWARRGQGQIRPRASATDQGRGKYVLGWGDRGLASKGQPRGPARRRNIGPATRNSRLSKDQRAGASKCERGSTRKDHEVKAPEG